MFKIIIKFKNFLDIQLLININKKPKKYHL